MTESNQIVIEKKNQSLYHAHSTELTKLIGLRIFIKMIRSSPCAGDCQKCSLLTPRPILTGLLSHKNLKNLRKKA
jgi:hypothetical protein